MILNFHIEISLKFIRNQINYVNLRKMAWRSRGSDNSDLISQLEGLYCIPICERKKTTQRMTKKFALFESGQFT